MSELDQYLSKEWIGFGFDHAGVNRAIAVRYGTIAEMAHAVYERAEHDKAAAFQLGAVLLVRSELRPMTLLDGASVALSKGLPRKLAELLIPARRSLWFDGQR